MKILILSALLFCFGVSYAQEFKGGLVLGINASQVDGDNLSGYNKIGPLLGVSITRKLKADHFSVRGEFLLSVKGAKAFIDENNIGVVDLRKLNNVYIDIPLMLQYQYKKFTFEAGPTLGVLLYATREDIKGKTTVTSDYNRFELAAFLGVDYGLKKGWSVFGRYSYSMMCIAGINCGSVFTNPKLRAGYFNNVIGVGLRKSFN